ncbi:MAG: metal ABC transporter permease [Shewanella sp.]|nr:metal ABC transporter permease [Shewanella sp.]MCF1430316.1 metal ABC transporter permease [Shewanella sp.]MCF1440042.1 metal ABC transporter permease [Shewanella sp.]MCF1459107.1 metal ABC transporter permease [Shewanella sp.]
MQVLLPAFVAGLLVLSTHVLLGRQVLKRGIIFIDLAIAQVAALGTVMVQMHHELGQLPFAHLWMPLGFALAAAVLIAWLEKHMADELEAMIGCFYVLAAASAMLLLSHDPHGGELLKQVLSGQILWVDWPALALPAVSSAAVLLAVLWHPALLQGRSFYLLFAFLITLSVELVGVYLVFSSLILPALAINRYQQKWALVWAYLVGAFGYLLGLWLSASYDLPAGAAIVVTLALSALLFRLTYSSLVPYKSMAKKPLLR